MSVAALEDVTKRFGLVTALDHVNLDVRSGDILALLGPNGAGKSTAIAMLLGLRTPDSGTVRVFGVGPRRTSARQVIGVALQESAYPATLRVRELLALVQSHYLFPEPAGALLRSFGLDALEGRQVGGLSIGERRRLAVALAFSGRPSLVVLDEPTAGLDMKSRRAVWAAIRAHAAQGGTTLLTTHQMEEAEALATRVVLIESGVIATDGTVASIKAEAGLARVTFRAPHGYVVEEAAREGDLTTVLTSDPGALVERLVLEGVRLVDLDVRPITLEEALSVREEALKLVLLHARVITLELLRYPAFLVPTLVFPAAFFVVFVPSGPGDPAIGMATFAGFAAIGVAFFQFGVGIAAERASAWEAYLRTLPVSPAARIASRVVSAAGFAAATAAAVVVVALATTSPTLSAARWGGLAATLLVGTAPFVLLGIALGYWAPQRGALPIANVLYLGLSYAGGLWIPPADLPRLVAGLSPLLPTRSLADALAVAASGRPFAPGPLVRLAVFGVVFGVLALWGFRRDEGRHYR